jgi:ferredoxin
MVDGKACLLREDYCDGLGNCLPVCPTGAIRFEHKAAEPGRSPQWPMQIKLVPVNALFFKDSALLVSADCCAYAYPRFHAEFSRDKTMLIGCPKLDDADYGRKLGEIITQNSITSITVVRMEVPCCAGMVNAAVTALKTADKALPMKVVVLTIDGQVTEQIKDDSAAANYLEF